MLPELRVFRDVLQLEKSFFLQLKLVTGLSAEHLELLPDFIVVHNLPSYMRPLPSPMIPVDL